MTRTSSSHINATKSVQAVLQTPKRGRSSSIDELPPAPRKKRQNHHFFETHDVHAMDSERLFVPTLSPESCRHSYCKSESGLPLVQLRPRFSPNVKQDPVDARASLCNHASYPLFPSLTSFPSGEESDSSEFSPLTQTLSDFLDI